MKNKLLLFLLLIASVAWGQTITEDFETQTALTPSYANGSFIGADGVTFTYVHSRNEALGTSDDSSIDGKGIMLRRANEPSSIEFTLPNGVGNLSFDYRKAFTGGSNNRQLAVFVNGVQEYVTPMFGASGTDTTVHTFNENIDEAGPVTIKITYPTGTDDGNRQITIDNISWTEPSASDHTITVTQPTGGEITPETTGVNNGDSASFTATPESVCYEFSHWIIDGIDAGNTNPYTFTNVTADHEITAVFNATSTYEITASAGANGSISPNGAVEVNCGADQTFNITADAGYAVADVLVNGTSVGAVTTYTFEGVTEDQAISASFVEFTGPCVEEDFSGIANSSNYGTRTWTGTGGTWTATDAREDQTINGNAITIRNGVLTSPEFTSGVSSITMTTKLPFSDTAGNLVVKVNDIEVGTIPYSSATTTSTISNVNIGGNIIVTVHSSGARVAIDDIEWTCYSGTQPTTPTLTTSVSELTDFVYGLGNGPSASQSFVLSGENLDGSEDVRLLADTGFEISLDDDTSFDNELVLTDYEGENTTIYVRLASGLALGAHSGIILIDGYGIEQEITVSGNVLAVPVIDDEEVLEAQVGVEYTYQIIATGEPTSYFIVEDPLPAGLELDETTGIISGTPIVAGEFMFGVIAENALGVSAQAAFIIDIAKGTQTVAGLGDINAYFGDADITLPETTEQGFTIVYDIIDPNGVATINGNELSFMDVGSVDFMAYTEDGDANYEDYTEVFTVTVTEEPAGPCLVETFDAGNPEWTMENVSYTESSGTASFNNQNGYLVTPELSFPNNLNFDLARTGNSNSKTFYVEISTVSPTEGFGSPIATYDHNNTTSGGTTSITVDLADYSSQSSVYIRFRKESSTSSPWRLDNIEVFCNEAPITTPITWTTEGVWSNITGPTINDDVVIEGDLSVGTDITNLEAKTLTVASTGSVYIESGNSITVAGAIDNQAGADNFIVASGANLVQINDLAVNKGEITFERTFNFSAERKQYNFIISPVKGQAIKPIYTGAPFVIYHKESKNFFYNAGAGAYDSSNPAKGFSIKEAAGTGAEAVTAKMKGEPFNGLASFPLTYTTTIPEQGYLAGYHLTGNPYPSNLDIQQLYNANSDNIESTFQFWDNRGNTTYEQEGSSYGGAHYAKYNAAAGHEGTGVAAGVPTDPGYDERVPTNLARPGTAFMIQALPAGNGQTLDFKNEYRVAENDSPEFYGKNSFHTESEDRYWLTMRTPTGIEYMTAVVYFANGNNDLGVEDSEANGSSDDIYTLVGQEQLAIQGRAPFKKTDVVPLGVRLFDMGIYVISLYDKEGVFVNGQNIYIRDRKLNTIYNLTQADYKFIEDKAEINDRFEIIYNPNQFTSVKASENASDVLIEKKDKNIVVTSSEHKITQMILYDINNRPIYQNTEVNALKFSLPFKQFSNQIVVVSLETETGEVVNKKLIIK